MTSRTACKMTVLKAAQAKGLSVLEFVKFFNAKLSEQRKHSKFVDLDCGCAKHFLFNKDDNQSISRELSQAYEETTAVLMLLPRERVETHADVIFKLEHWVDVWQGVKTWDDILAQLTSVA